MTYQDSKEALITEVKRFVDKNPQSKCTFYQGQRIIKQGENSTECFLITQGAVRILVREGKSESEKEIISREPGDLIGEMAFLQRNQRRTASVEVVTDKASFIRITRSDIFSMMHENPQLGDALERLQHLATTRSKETEQVLKGEIIIEQRMMSVLLADIHNFTLLGESIWEEHINNFLFDFLESTEEIVESFGGIFEDQGDGFKVLFNDDKHVETALNCALILKREFMRLRDYWSDLDNSFEAIGLGIGICSDFMSIRRRHGSRRGQGRILSHTINIAAAISKYRTDASDVEIYINEGTLGLIDKNQFILHGPFQERLEKLLEPQVFHRLVGKQQSPSEHHDHEISDEQAEAGTSIYDTETTTVSQIEQAKLVNALREYFSEGELRDLCLELGTDYQELPGDGTGDKCRELVGYFSRRQRLRELTDAIREKRPNANL